MDFFPLFEFRGSIPSFVLITPGRVSDVSALDDLVLEAGSFYVMDRGYIHFLRLYRFVLAAAFFVVRARQVRYFDAEHDVRLSLLTNHFALPALTIMQLYKARWNVAILKRRLGLQASLYKILRTLSVTQFEKMPILQASEGTDYELSPQVRSNQLTLFDS